VLPYDDYQKQPNVRARLAALIGLLGVAFAPAVIVLHIHLARVTLLMATAGIATGCTIFGFIALFLARRARLRRVVSLERIGGAKQAAFGRLTGTLALSIGLGACISLAVYALLASR
jgi:uncharacterized membrane protein